MWRRVTVLAASAAALAGCPTAASAGSYRVYSCVAPSGGSAPVGDGSYGWQPSGRSGTTSLSLTNDCGAGHGLAAVLQSAQPYGAGGQWTFQPPPATRIAAFDLTWSGTAAAGGESTISRSDQPDPTYERRYGQDFATERVTTSFKGRRLRVRGRLVGPDGKPIAGARIDVLSQLHRAGARMRAIGSTRTSRKGGFSFKAPPGASRTLRFGYRSHVNDTAFTTTLDVLQRVKASATLRASRRFVPRGGSVTFRGRLRGGYVPPRGKLVELQATDRGRWRTFALVRSSRSGAFRYRYRYRFSGSGRFAFRARVRFERAYPYVLGYSRRTSVSVG